MTSLPVHLIDEPVEVWFNTPPLLEKTPPCPDGLIWRGDRFTVLELLEAWRDNERRGTNARNMRPEHASRAARVGSWGVGRFYYRVKVTGGRIFDLYYDRSPQNALLRKGQWILKGERTEENR